MFGKVKVYLKKCRIFSRLRYLIAENLTLKRKIVRLEAENKSASDKFQNILIKNNKAMFKLEEEKKKIKERHIRASKHVAKMVKQKYEFLSRIQTDPSNIPDDIISGDMRTYRVWLMEPFMSEHCLPFNPVSRREIFIDGPSAAKGFIEVSKSATKEEEKEDN